MPVWMHSSMKRLDYSVYSFIQKVIIISALRQAMEDLELLLKHFK